MDPVIHRKPITQRINRAFIDSVYNQAEFARKAGVSEATVSRWLSGETTNLHEETRKLIAQVLHVRERWLETGYGEMRDARTGSAQINEEIANYSIDELLKEERSRLGIVDIPDTERGRELQGMLDDAVSLVLKIRRSIEMEKRRVETDS